MTSKPENVFFRILFRPSCKKIEKYDSYGAYIEPLSVILIRADAGKMTPNSLAVIVRVCVSRSENPVTLGEWHTVHASRTGRLGQLTLDAQSTSMEGISPGRFTQLTLSSRLFVGGSSNWKHVFHSAGVNRSFHGCVQLVSITIPLLSHRYCSRYISIVTAANEAVFSLAFVCLFVC